MAAPFPITNPVPVAYSLYSTILNSSGKEATFSFIPPHGRVMAPNEQLTVAGNIIDRLAVKTSNRQFKAMERAVAAGHLTIVFTPGQYVYVAGATKVQVVGIAAGAIGMVDPIYDVAGTGEPPDEQFAEPAHARR